MNFIVTNYSPTDERRAANGKNLRHYFMHETGYNLSDEEQTEPCKILECLVALASDLDDILGEPEENHEYVWFWDMIQNLKLNRYTDNNYNEGEVTKILIRWMSRLYLPNGEGGLFPLKHPYVNQKYVGIWEQAASYINENY